MKALALEAYLSNRRFIYSSLFLSLIFFFSGFKSWGNYMIFLYLEAILVGLLVKGGGENKWTSYKLALPISRKDQVKSIYGLANGIYLLKLLAFFLAYILIGSKFKLDLDRLVLGLFLGLLFINLALVLGHGLESRKYSYMNLGLIAGFSYIFKLWSQNFRPKGATYILGILLYFSILFISYQLSHRIYEKADY